MVSRDTHGRFTKRPDPPSGAGPEWIALGVLLAMLIVLFLSLVVRVARSEDFKPPCPALASRHDPVLDAFARAHADRQAAQCRQGHQGFEKRSAKILAVFPGRQVAEICAESWRWQVKCTKDELWVEAVRCWKQSPGHWSVANRKHWRIGSGLAKGRNDIWYLTVIAVD